MSKLISVSFMLNFICKYFALY